VNTWWENQKHLTRRQFFGRTSCGLGTAALAWLLSRDGRAAQVPLTAPQRFGGLPELPHFPPKARRVIYLFMNGAPTHVDLFDYKPRLQTMHGQPVPEEYFRGLRFSTMTGDPRGKLLLAPVEPFRRRGQCGAWESDFLPHTTGIVDDLCFIKSMHTEAVNHAPAINFLLTGADWPGVRRWAPG
jgi:hypothetical protein